mmetsp:Transcript_25933/g.56914  ORF Transcript_25933/g.56914 Transcript_25933/m.56914 type:complete len:171 (-) Transcript_25933:103-615(-)
MSVGFKVMVWCDLLPYVWKHGELSRLVVIIIKRKPNKSISIDSGLGGDSLSAGARSVKTDRWCGNARVIIFYNASITITRMMVTTSTRSSCTQRKQDKDRNSEREMVAIAPRRETLQHHDDDALSLQHVLVMVATSRSSYMICGGAKPSVRIDMPNNLFNPQRPYSLVAS